MSQTVSVKIQINDGGTFSFRLSANQGTLNGNRESLMQQSWEQTRTVVLAALQPYSKKTLRGPDVLPFSWDKKKTPPKPVEKSTRERMEAVKARLKKR